MKSTLLFLVVSLFMVVYLYVFKLVKKTSYYRRVKALYEQAKKVPMRVSSKGDYRRLRKYAPYLKEYRRRMLKLSLINIGVFMAVYTAMLFTSYLLMVYQEIYVVETPITIPFFTYIDESGRLYIHSTMVVIISLAATHYPILRELRMEK
jgi:hypothetical protein